MVLYKTFRTAKNYYLYDTSTNKVVNLYKKAYNYINNAKKGNEFKLEEKSIKEYDFFKSLMEREGILSNVEYKYRFPYDKEELVYIYKNNVQNIILELTNSCNMRCKYCTFNNCYQDSPSYSSDRMSLDNVKKSIDFLFNNSSNNNLKVVSFFGGEPLLCYNMICSAIKYVKEKYKYNNIKYNITSNLTLLDDEMLEMFVKNKVYITASLDGPKDINDYNRVLLNGEGSFDIVFEKLMRIKKDYPDYYLTHTNVSAVLPSMKAFERVAPFFEELGLEVFFSDMVHGSTYPIDEYINFIDKKRTDYSFDEIKSIYFENLSNNVKIKAFSSFFKYNEAFKLNHQNNDKYCFPSGPCLPGLTRTFIQSDGTIYPCEKVNNGKSYYSIGDIVNGFDYTKLTKLINMYRRIGNRCASCWAINKCKKCWTTITEDDCEVQKRKVINNLVSSMEIYENFPLAIENL